MRKVNYHQPDLAIGPQANPHMEAKSDDNDDEYEFMHPSWCKSVSNELRDRFDVLHPIIQARYNRDSLIPLYVGTILDAVLKGRVTEKQLDALEKFIHRKTGMHF
jgi:hypothetical protein